MSRLVESQFPNHDELIFPCDCRDGHYLRLVWDENDPEWRTLWVEEVQSADRWNWRLRTALRALFGQDTVAREVILSQDKVDSLADYLLKQRSEVS